MKRQFTIVGAGLVGSLLAALLARRGHAVRVFEALPDPRHGGFAGGRSINLALAERGLAALRAAGLAERICDDAVIMRGRMVHDREGNTNLQRYGLHDHEVIWSVSRGGLNITLLNAAADAGAELHFDSRLVDVDFDAGTMMLEGTEGDRRTLHSGVLLGADGAGSALRAAMNRHAPLGERVEPLHHAYKELEIPPATLGKDTDFADRFSLEPHALHIWPRGGYMCIALPNSNGSYTVTLFLAEDGEPPSFAHLGDTAAARALFERDFADALTLMPSFDRDFAEHPVGKLATLYLDRWHQGGDALLLGDAAHAIVPFHGQGMNAGFEDALALADLLEQTTDDPAAVFAAFSARRKPDADAIATMALENYVEMRDSVADPDYLRKRDLVRELSTRCPDHIMSRYRMVSFTCLPYSYCLQRGRAQDAVIQRILDTGAAISGRHLEAAVQRVQTELPPLPR